MNLCSPLRSATPISGGDINEAYKLVLADGSQVFMKANRSVDPAFFQAEADGLEAPNGDAHAYAEAMRRLAGDPELRQILGESGRERVREHFLYDRFRERIREAVAALADGGASEH